MYIPEIPVFQVDDAETAAYLMFCRNRNSAFLIRRGGMFCGPKNTYG